MIRSFGDRKTADFFAGKDVREWRSIQRVAERKLTFVDSATTLRDLASPPGNRLEKLEGDRKGQHSIRINDQRRICFVWHQNGPHGVEITDYH